jgi:hypothetical protein
MAGRNPPEADGFDNELAGAVMVSRFSETHYDRHRLIHY